MDSSCSGVGAEQLPEGTGSLCPRDAAGGGERVAGPGLTGTGRGIKQRRAQPCARDISWELCEAPRCHPGHVPARGWAVLVLAPLGWWQQRWVLASPSVPWEGGRQPPAPTLGPLQPNSASCHGHPRGEPGGGLCCLNSPSMGTHAPRGLAGSRLLPHGPAWPFLGTALAPWGPGAAGGVLRWTSQLAALTPWILGAHGHGGSPSGCQPWARDGDDPWQLYRLLNYVIFAKSELFSWGSRRKRS